MPYHPKYCNIFLTSKDILLQNCITTIKIRKLTLIHHCNLILMPHSVFTSCPNKGFYRKRIQFRILCWASVSISLICFILEHFPSLCLIFMTLKLLKITDQFFCRMSLNFCLYDISSWIELMYAFLAGILQK